MPPSRRQTSSHRLARLALRAWPAPARRRDGGAILRTFREATAEAGPGTVLAEIWSIVATGLGMRIEDLRSTAREGVTGWGADVRYAVRVLRRSPGFTAVASCVLAIGVGANAATFGLVRTTLLEPPPFDDPERLVFVWGTLGDGAERFRVGAPDVAFLSDAVDALTEVAFMAPAVDGAVEATDGSGAAHVRRALVSANLFDVVGVDARIGRTFGPSDTEGGDGGQPGGARAVLLSDGVWHRVFGGAPDVLGRTIRLDGAAVTVVGVLPPDFRFPTPPGVGFGEAPEVWVPLARPLADFARSDGRWRDQDSDNTGAMIARLPEGVTVAGADADAARASTALGTVEPTYAEAGVRFVVRPLHADATAHLRGILTAVAGGVVVVLLVMCLNLSTLVAARGLRRSRELVVRAAIGAGRLRVLRQQLTEVAVLVAVGSTLAMAVAGVASWGIARMGATWGLGESARTVDLGTLLVGTLIGGVAALLAAAFTVATLLRVDDASGLAGGLKRASRRHDFARSGLLVGQVALSVVLLLGAGVLVRTVHALEAVDPGFRAEGALGFSLSVRTPGRYGGPADRARLMREIETRIGEIPGVDAVGLTTHLPLADEQWTQPYGPASEPPEAWEGRADFRAVTSGYFESAGLRLLQGRSFIPDEDLHEERRVVIVDRLLAERVAPDGSAVGRAIGLPLDGAIVQAEIVGVVEHVRHTTLAADGREAVYVPYRQEASRDVHFVVRAEPVTAPAIRAAIASLDPQLPVYAFHPLTDDVEAAVAEERLGFALLFAFAAMAVVAVASGLYGVTALEVGRRTREYGVRLAIGATRLSVVRSIFGRGLVVAGSGTAVGALVALALRTRLDTLAFGTSTGDPWVWAGIVLTVAGATAAACAGPAWRAARLDPREALRAES